VFAVARLRNVAAFYKFRATHRRRSSALDQAVVGNVALPDSRRPDVGSSGWKPGNPLH
jgi:hypothetical protein